MRTRKARSSGTERSQRDVEDGVPPHRTQRMSFLLLSTRAPLPSKTVTTTLQTTLSPTERALYAALAPTPSTSAVLKAVCRTWEDHLWALVSIACEERLSLGLARIARECFWESGLGALESSAAGEANGVPDEEEEEEWEADVKQMLEALGGVQVAEGAPADHPYHVSQLHIILERTDELLESFANGLQEGLYVSAPE